MTAPSVSALPTPRPVAAPAAGLTGAQATAAIARLSFKRVVRGKALWVALASALLPAVAAFLYRTYGGPDKLELWEPVFVLCALLFVIVPPVLVSSSIADEIDDKTSAYLWSRALPRWSLVAGKLLALAPLSAAVLLFSLTLSWLILGTDVIPSDVYLRGAAGLVAGTIAASAIAALLATLFPRFAIAITVGWMLVDSTLGALDMKLHVLSALFGARAIAGFTDESIATAVISLVVLTVVCVTIAIRRISRMEV